MPDSVGAANPETVGECPQGDPFDPPFLFLCVFFPQTVYCWGSILERKELATVTGRAPELCGWASWLGSVAGLCGWALSSSCPPLGSAPDRAQLCGWALWLGSVAELFGVYACIITFLFF